MIEEKCQKNRYCSSAGTQEKPLEEVRKCDKTGGRPQQTEDFYFLVAVENDQADRISDHEYRGRPKQETKPDQQRLREPEKPVRPLHPLLPVVNLVHPGSSRKERRQIPGNFEVPVLLLQPKLKHRRQRIFSESLKRILAQPDPPAQLPPPFFRSNHSEVFNFLPAADYGVNIVNYF